MANILERIAKILELADNAGTDAEREQALATAEKLMSAHKIEEAAARALNVSKGMADATQNVVTDKRIQFVSEVDEFRPIFEDCVHVLSKLCGVRLVYSGYNQIWLVGYERDIDYFQMLWTSTHLAFSGKLFPEWNRGASPQRQIRAWVEAGYKWDYIWSKAKENGQPFTRTVKGETVEVPCPPADNGWMKRMLKKAYAETGEEKPRLTHGVKNYRHSYAVGFGEAFTTRIWDMIWARQDAERNAGGGAQLVLAKDVDAIQAYFDKLFPPGQLGFAKRRKLSGNHSGAAAAGGAAARNADLSGGSGGIAGRRSAGALGS